jgi:hypothetical protein
MPAPKIDLDVSFDMVLDENSFTMGLLPSHPLAAPFASKFDAFQTTLEAAMMTRMTLVIAVSKAEGTVMGADAALDDFIDTFDRTLLIAVKNDRKAPLYQLFFAHLPPSLLKRPILGDELATVRAWVPSLQGSPVTAVAALAPALVAAVDAADKAIAAHTAAEQALKDFDAVGGKKTIIDAFNALRQTVHGELAAMPHQHPDAMLPTDFADRFFRHNLNKGISSITSLKTLESKIASSTKELTALQAQHKLVSDARAAKTQQKANKTKHEADIEQAKKDRDAAEEKLRALEKQKV